MLIVHYFIMLLLALLALSKSNLLLVEAGCLKFFSTDFRSPFVQLERILANNTCLGEVESLKDLKYAFGVQLSNLKPREREEKYGSILKRIIKMADGQSMNLDERCDLDYLETIKMMSYDVPKYDKSTRYRITELLLDEMRQTIRLCLPLLSNSWASLKFKFDSIAGVLGQVERFADDCHDLSYKGKLQQLKAIECATVKFDTNHNKGNLKLLLKSDDLWLALKTIHALRTSSFELRDTFNNNKHTKPLTYQQADKYLNGHLMTPCSLLINDPEASHLLARSFDLYTSASTVQWNDSVKEQQLLELFGKDIGSHQSSLLNWTVRYAVCIGLWTIDYELLIRYLMDFSE